MSDLEARLLTAHATNDRRALVALYAEAADQADDHDTACFYLTHAYIFALETNDPAASELLAELRAQGRA